MKKELGVNESVQFGFRKAKAVAVGDTVACTGCIFDARGLCEWGRSVTKVLGDCNAENRRDNTNVIFVLTD